MSVPTGLWLGITVNAEGLIGLATKVTGCQPFLAAFFLSMLPKEPAG